MKHPVLLRPECVTLGGDVVVGLLLSQIVYWYQPDAKGKSETWCLQERSIGLRRPVKRGWRKRG